MCYIHVFLSDAECCLFVLTTKIVKQMWNQVIHGNNAFIEDIRGSFLTRCFKCFSKSQVRPFVGTAIHLHHKFLIRSSPTVLTNTAVMCTLHTLLISYPYIWRPVVHENVSAIYICISYYDLITNASSLVSNLWWDGIMLISCRISPRPQVGVSGADQWALPGMSSTASLSPLFP